MMVHPDSHRGTRAPWYLGTLLRVQLLLFTDGAITLFGRPSQDRLVKQLLLISLD